MAESTLFHMQALDILAPLFAGAAVGAAILDRRGRVLHANPAWRRVAGESQDAPISKATLPAALQAAVEPLMQQVLGGEAVQAQAVPAPDAGGAQYWDLYLSPVVQNGQAEAVLLIATEATERANAAQQMRQALESARRREGRLSSTFTALEDIVSAIAAYLVSLAPNDIDAGILRSLEILGEFSGADRSYIFLFAGDEQTVINTHAWTAKGVKGAALPGKDYAIQEMPWIYEVIKRGEALHVPSVNDLLPAQSPDRALLRRIGVRSFIAVPMMYEGRVLGLLGFDTLRKERTWSAESIKLLQIVAEFLVSALEQKRAQAIQAGQRQFLELLARGGSLSETLHTLVTLIEEQWPGMLGLVLLLDEDGRSLHVGAAASLPQDYLDSLEGLEIGPQVGSCGTAAYLGERVVVTDIDTDPRWENLRGLVEQHGLKACWSEPVIDSSGRVIGTFAMYYRHPRSPTEEELRTIEISAHLAGVAIEHQRAQKDLQAAYNLLEQRVNERTRELFTLLDVSHDLASTLDLRMLLGQLLDQLRAVVGYEGASVLELSGESLRVVAYRGPIPQEQALQLQFTLQQAGANRLVIESGEPVIISDVRSDDALASEFRETAGDELTQAFRYVRCWMGVPLVVHKKVIGMLSLDHRQPYAYRAESHGRLTQAFANQAAVAMENARLYAEAKRRAEESQTLYAIQQAITSRRDPQSVLQMIADQARRLTNTEQGAVYLLEGDELLISVISGDVDVEMLGYRLPVDGSMAGLAIKTGRSYRVGEADADERVEKALVEKVGAHAFVIVPLVLSTGPVGTITVANKRSGSFGADDEEILKRLASGAAVALENARIYQEEQERRLEAERRRRVAESLRDILTVINSARPLEEILACIVEQAAQLMRSDAGVIYFLNHQPASLEIVASCGLPESFAGAGRLPVYQGGAVQALLDRKPYIIPDIQRHMAQITQQTKIHSETSAWLQQLYGSFASYLGIPLVIRDELYGSLSLYHFEVREFSEEEVQLIVTFADQAALAIENARLRAEAARSAAAAERSRLARDLHDAVTQTLFSASLIAEVLPRLFERDQAEGEKRLEELRQLTRGALAEMRTLLLELRPAALIEAELGELFRHLADAFVGRTRIPVEVVVEGSYNPPPDVKVAMYRIVQEALNNVIKHAEAGQVWLYIKSRGGRVELDIRDDGVGFDPATIPPEHLGIGIMKERAEAVDAQLSMESRPGAGTHIAFTWEQPG